MLRPRHGPLHQRSNSCLLFGKGAGGNDAHFVQRYHVSLSSSRATSHRGCRLWLGVILSPAGLRNRSTSASRNFCLTLLNGPHWLG